MKFSIFLVAAFAAAATALPLGRRAVDPNVAAVASINTGLTTISTDIGSLDQQVNDAGKADLVDGNGGNTPFIQNLIDKNFAAQTVAGDVANAGSLIPGQRQTLIDALNDMVTNLQGLQPVFAGANPSVADTLSAVQALIPKAQALVEPTGSLDDVLSALEGVKVLTQENQPFFQEEGVGKDFDPLADDVLKTIIPKAEAILAKAKDGKLSASDGADLVGTLNDLNDNLNKQETGFGEVAGFVDAQRVKIVAAIPVVQALSS